MKDVHGHGTAMSGVIAATQNNAFGIAGIASNAKIMTLKNGNGISFVSDNVRAINYAVANGAKVINMSFSGTGYSQLEADTVQQAYDAGVVLVGSAGNSGVQELRYPSSHPQVLSVGAITPGDSIARFSTYNSLVDVVAPGYDILTLASRWSLPTEREGAFFTRVSGTSPASAHVAAVAALILQANPGKTSGEITTAILSSCDLLLVDHLKQGYGKVNALEALAQTGTAITLISSPLSNEVVKGIVSVNGTVFASDLKEYRLFLKPGAHESLNSYNSIGSGSSAITNGVMGNFDSLSYSDGLHTLLLELETDDGRTYKIQTSIDIGNSYGTPLPNWPKSVYSMPGSGTAADVDGDGVMDFVGIGGLCDIAIANGLGNTLPGWAQKRFYPTHTAIAPAAVGDLDGDGDAEVVFETRYQNVTQHNSYFTLHAYSHTGQILTGWPKNLFKGTDFESSTNKVSGPVIADLDGDGKNDVITLGAKIEQNGVAMVYAFDVAGNDLTGWPVELGLGTIGSNSSPVIADIDADGEMEVGVIVGNGSIYILEADGSVKPGWPRTLGPATNQGGSVSVGDFDHDANFEILAATYSGHIALYESSGQIIDGWPQQMPSPAFQLAMADLDEDGDLEIVIPAVNTLVGGKRSLYVWHHDGTIATGWPVEDTNMSLPIIFDFDGDQRLDIVASSFHYTRAYQFDGTEIETLGLPREGGMANHSLAADFTGDGTMDLLVTQPGAPFSVSILNYPTRVLDPAYTPWPQPGITSFKNRAFSQARLAELGAAIVHIQDETQTVKLLGKNLIAGNRILIGDIACQNLSETTDQIIFTIPADIPLGNYDLKVIHASTGSVVFPSAVFVAENLASVSELDSLGQWTSRYRPEVFESTSIDADRLPGGDYDKDGVPNALEFALRDEGYDPEKADRTQTPSMRREAEMWVMEYTFDPDMDWTATPQVSTDLVHWFSPGDEGIPLEVELEDLGPGTSLGTRHMQVRVPADPPVDFFIRIKFQ